MDALEELIALLDLERLEVNLFRGVSWKDDRPRVFGGQVAGQALVAAGRTVEGRPVHSLHAYFLRPGDPSIPIVYDVDRIRDGKSFTTRRVVAIQHGEAIFNLQASFHAPEPGFDHQAPMPEVPDPETLPRAAELDPPVVAGKAWFDRPGPIDIRYVGNPPSAPTASPAGHYPSRLPTAPSPPPPTPSPCPPRRCAGPWPKPMSATTSTPRTPRSTASRSWLPPWWARRPLSTCPRAPWAIRSRCA